MSNLTTKQIKAKLSGLKYSFDGGELTYELLEGYMEHDAEGTELEPFVKATKESLIGLLTKFDEMLEQYGMNEEPDDSQLEFDFDTNDKEEIPF